MASRLAAEPIAAVLTLARGMMCVAAFPLGGIPTSTVGWLFNLWRAYTPRDVDALFRRLPVLQADLFQLGLGAAGAIGRWLLRPGIVTLPAWVSVRRLFATRRFAVDERGRGVLERETPAAARTATSA